MATLKLGQITCVKKQDTIGTDLVDLYVDGVFKAGPWAVKKNGDKKPAIMDETISLTKDVVLMLKERDGAKGGDNDDVLGTWTVSPDDDHGPAIFDDLKHAYYTVEFTVT